MTVASIKRSSSAYAEGFKDGLRGVGRSLYKTGRAILRYHMGYRDGEREAGRKRNE